MLRFERSNMLVRFLNVAYCAMNSLENLTTTMAACLQPDVRVSEPFSKGLSKEYGGDMHAVKFRVLAHHPTQESMPMTVEFRLLCKSTNIAGIPTQIVLDYAGAVQPHGVFFLLHDDGSLKVKACSENAEILFPGKAQDLLGKSFLDLFEEKHRIESTIHSLNGSGQMMNPEELDPCDDFVETNAKVRIAIKNLDLCHTPLELSQQFCWDAFKIMGYDRMFVGNFYEDGTSMVEAERRVKVVKDAWQGLRWPEETLSPSVRMRFLKIRFSTVNDAGANPAKIITNDPTLEREHINLGSSLLRASHRCYLEQLGAWGMRSSITYPIVLKDTFHAMLVGHSLQARHPSIQMRVAVSALTDAYTLELLKVHERKSHTENQRIFSIFDHLFKKICDGNLGGLVEGIPNVSDIVENLQGTICGRSVFGFDVKLGAAIYHQNELMTIGDLPSQDSILKIVEALKRRSVQSPERQVQAFNSLREIIPDLDSNSVRKAAGCICIPILESSMILLFRPENLHTVSWAGNPKVKAIWNEPMGTMHPRHDYTPFVEKVEATCVAWTSNDLRAAKSFASVVNAVIGSGRKDDGVVLEAVDGPMAVVQDGIVISCNEAFAKLLECQKKDVEGKEISNCMKSDVFASVQATMKSALALGDEESTGLVVKEIQTSLLRSSTSVKLSSDERNVVNCNLQISIRSGAGSSKNKQLAFLWHDMTSVDVASAKKRKSEAALHLIDKTAEWLKPHQLSASLDSLEYHPDPEESSSAVLEETALGKTFSMKHKNDGVLYMVKKLNLKKIEKSGVPVPVLKQRLNKLLSKDSRTAIKYRTCFQEGGNVWVVAEFNDGKQLPKDSDFLPGKSQAT
eukprot:747391-Hanusia_phi.AAC.3